jgi:wyosine [tRNA(Phe)-imidazoG37] synthetase (radical SAM superfamily)
MYMAPVRRAACEADVVKVSLSAWDEASFRAVNRPHPDLDFATVLEGLRRLGAEYEGELWLEVFIVPGLNSGQEQVRRIAELADEIGPDKVQLNTAVRPAAEPDTAALGGDELEELAGVFGSRGEVIAGARTGPAAECGGPGKIVDMLARRPCTAADVAVSCGMAEEQARKMLQEMKEKGAVFEEEREGAIYYAARRR